MPTSSVNGGGREGLALAAIAALTLTLAACGGEPAGSGAAPVAGSTQAGAEASASDPAPGASAEDAPAQAVGDPVRLRIPAIGVDTPVIPLSLDAAGTLIAPEGFDEVGWNHAGPEPGEDGPAVIAGHVDSFEGPAVFFDLRELAPGDEIHVDQAGGGTVTFTVTRTEQYPKDAVPDDVVYALTPDPELRLITCGGSFDDSEGSYRDNLVVFAEL
ncbi:class F sortase [Allonocardiopsis opalescens]|uniref:LPXTG-site transpeptidase (Sortase) family protein n=1 Tax=Allonocardiopsis opalescens TaxID=1144618 RepID=A0A2T0PX93_9ACTN|nr:class F sortase [Allonocardiopsis opalescens]PRX96163.1 LPXTG-site transpeptidase (sortase) family protein [Allonocardiopsis opalescens]